ncbi:folylpolyglutamate synthase/dihydrofolate synthase family protein [Arcanobacterium hippocoleae]
MAEKFHNLRPDDWRNQNEPLNQDDSPAEAESLDKEALAALLSSGLIVGPDPAIIAEVKAAPDPIVQLANDSALEAQVNQIYREIISRAPEHQVQPSLERVRACLDLLGNPQDSYRAIHITGTNGKTSTARMIEALLRERGLRTGRFTSPHLNSVRERIAIDGKAISPANFIDAWEDVRPVIELVDARSQAAGGPRLSFFEVFVVMAYSAFSMAPIDAAVVEVGMGGRWDATNVINADVSVLMPIALDHQQWLGDTVEDIAAEKLGILKPGKTLVTAHQLPNIAEMITADVREKKAQLLAAGRDFALLSRERAVGGQMLTVRTPAAVYEDIPLAMFGEYQAENAAVALNAVEAFFGGGSLPGEVVEHALMTVKSPGRMEVVKGSPVIIVDAAHNPAGAKVSAQTLEENFPGPRAAVYAAMADKDIEGVLAEIEPAFAAIVVTQMGGERAADAEDIARIACEVFGEDRVSVEPDLGNAISTAVDLAETADPEAIAPASVVVLGSIQLAAAARELLGAYRPDQG